MFTHAKEVGWKEQEQVICRGHWQLVPREDTEAKALVIQMVGFQTTQEETQRIYNKVYQQKRLVGPHYMGQGRWKPLTGKSASLEEQTWWRWVAAKPEEDLQGAPVPILWPSCQTEFCHQT